jgi:hypothetical protein
MRLGLRKSDAALQVASTLEDANFPFGQRRGSPQKTIASWRDRLKQKKAGPYEASLWRELLAEEPASSPTADTAAIRRDLLTRLGHIARAVRADISN